MRDPCELCVNNVPDEYGTCYCAQGAALDEDARTRAVQNDIVVLRSSQPVFDTCLAIWQTMQA